MTFADLVKLEPALGDLLAECRQSAEFPRRWRKALWHDGPHAVLRRLEVLVGRGRPDNHPLLSTAAAWQLAADRLRDELEGKGHVQAPAPGQRE